MFKDIKGYEGLYQINEYGDVKSSSRRKGSILSKERILKPHENNCGYVRVTLCKESICKKFLLHKLVYSTFVEEIPKGLTIHHKDEIKTNNHVSNLILATQRENNHFSRVEKGYKLFQEDVDFIRENNLSTREISDKYGISLRHALRILKNERWVD